MTNQYTRRTALGCIASLTGLAGCLGLGGPTSGGDGFETASVDGTTLTVTVADGSAISKVNVIAPDDSLAWERDVAAGARTVTIDIGLSYQPGTYHIVGVDGDSTVAETTLDIAPDIAITRVGVGANNLDEMPEDQPFKEAEALVEIQNRGNGPEVIDHLLILGDVPNPTEDLAERDDGSGIYDTKDGYGNLENPVCPPDSTKVFFTSSKPFASDGSGDCSASGRFKVRLLSNLNRSPVEADYDISYNKDESGSDCNISIQSTE